MSFDARDIHLMAEGAMNQAMAYLVEVAGVVEGEPMPPEKHQILVVAIVETIALLEVTLRKNLKNPESWAQARATINDLVEKISGKVLDMKPKGGIILGK